MCNITTLALKCCRRGKPGKARPCFTSCVHKWVNNNLLCYCPAEIGHKTTIPINAENATPFCSTLNNVYRTSIIVVLNGEYTGEYTYRCFIYHYICTICDMNKTPGKGGPSTCAILGTNCKRLGPLLTVQYLICIMFS